MKRTVLLTAALALGLNMQADEAKSEYSITTDFTYTTQYFFRGVKNQEQAFQPSVTLTDGAWTTGVWASEALNKKTQSWAQGREIDFFASYAYAIDEKYTLTTGGTYYYYMSARPSLSEPKYTYELNVALSGPVGPLTGKVTAFHDFKLDSNTFQLDLGYSVPLPDEKGSFDVGGYYGTTDIGDFDGGLPGTGGYDYQYYGLDASVSYKCCANTTIKLGVHWTDVSSLPTPDDNVWVTLGVTSNF